MGAAAGPSTRTPSWRVCVEPLAQSARPLQGVVEFVAADEDVGQGGVGRVVHPAAELQFFFVEADEVVAGGVLHGVVILKISLQHDFAGRLAASGASGNLGEELEGALGGAEVGEAESDVGTDDADQRDAVNVVALGDHLRADEQIEFAFVQSRSGCARSLRGRGRCRGRGGRCGPAGTCRGAALRAFLIRYRENRHTHCRSGRRLSAPARCIRSSGRPFCVRACDG